MQPFKTVEAYQLRLMLSESIESLRVEAKWENLYESRLYFDLYEDDAGLTYSLVISFWPRLPATPSVLNSERTIKLPQVFYRDMFMQLWDLLSLGEYPIVYSDHDHKVYPHTLVALTNYLPTRDDVKLWQTASS